MAAPKMPCVKVLDAAMQTLLQADLPARLAPWLADMATEDEPEPQLTLRWRRNRYTDTAERPCIALAFVADEPADQGEQQLSLGETLRRCSFDIIADGILPPEDEAERADRGDALARSDVARIELLSPFVLIPLAILKRPFMDEAETIPTPLRLVADEVQDLGMDDDEDLADENGRLVGRANVLYRVRSDDPTVLLAYGEN